jgi:DNA-binding NarL/FixJ family response regulator
MSRPRVLLADDHRIVTEGLKSLLDEEFDVVGVVEDGFAMVAAALRLMPDVIVADISMPRLNGLDGLARLKAEAPRVKVVFLTMHANPAYARRALEAGASGFVVKHSAATELGLAIRAALKDQTFLTPTLAAEVLRTARRGPRDCMNQLGQITPRQREILQLLAEGKSAKHIAETLVISPRTVEYHKYQMMESHGLHSTTELVQFALKNGIVTI